MMPVPNTQDDDRPEGPQQQLRRPLAPVRPAAGVVAGEAVDDRPCLERDRAEEQHPQEDVQGQQAADAQDRVALDRQQDQQHRSGHGGQPLVALGPAGALGRLRLRAGDGGWRMRGQHPS
jgi:hypothetical protein